MSKILFSLVLLSLIPSTALAQITPDSSLGTEKSVVESSGNRDTIKGGAIRDANLFHSFTEFNVEALREAYFANPDGIANIFSRVTGNNISNIQGVLGVLGDANLYLINPNGILFGENARLDVNGSFFATTADSVVFGNGFEFSAVNPNQPPLLKIDIPIGLRFRDNPGDITVRGKGNGARLLESEVIDTQEALRVDSNATIGLIGGNLFLEDATIKTAGGRIEIGSIAEGKVNLVEVANGLTFDYSGVETFRDISLSGTSVIDASGLGGGDIRVAGQNISITGVSGFTSFTLGSMPGKDINILATESLSISGVENDNNFVSAISTSIFPQGIAEGGDINIETRTLELGDRALISTSVLGQGNAGDININARESVSLESQGNTSAIASSVAEGAIGNGGDINVTTLFLSLKNGAFFNAGTSGQGNSGSINISGNFLTLSNGAILSTRNLGQGMGGDVTINATDNVSLTNGSVIIVTGAEGGTISLNAKNLSIIEDSFLFAGIDIDSGFPGAQSGDVVINLTEDLVLDGLDGESITFISNNNFGTGNAGSIDIFARNITFNNGGNVSGNNNGQGSIGNINLTATGDIIFDGSKEAQRSGVVNFVNLLGTGNVGEITITAKNLSLTNGAQIQSLVSGKGDSGDINLNIADNIRVDGFGEFVSEDGTKAVLPSAISSNVGSKDGISAEGNSGNIDINTSKLALSNGGRIDANIFGIGNAGNIDITARESINLDGKSPQGVLFSDISSTVNPGAVGNGGNIQISTQDFSVFNNAAINTGTGGQGNGGNVNITATNLDLIDGSDITASTFGIDTNNITQGNAGNITIKVIDTININGIGTINFQGQIIESPAGIFASNGGNRIGDAGKIDITANKLFMGNGSQINSFTRGKGNAGFIDINISESIFLDGENEFEVLTGISTDVTESGIGNAGEINLKTSNLNLINGGQITSDTFGQGNAGSVTINATDIVSLDGENRNGVISIIGSSVESGAIGNAGKVSIETKKLTLTNGAQIQSATFGEGDAGIITINTIDTVSLDGESRDGTNSAISSSVQPGAIGNAGKVSIDTGNLTLTNGAFVNSSTFGEGNAGSVTIKATDTVSLDGEDKDGNNSEISSSVQPEAIGKGGEVSIDTVNLSLTNGAQINTSTFGKGNAGSVTIKATNNVSLDGKDTDGSSSTISSSVDSEAVVNAGEVRIDTQNLTLTNESQIISDTVGAGNANSVKINVTNLALTNGAQIGSSTGSKGSAGSVIVRASDSVELRGVSAFGRSGLFASATKGTGNSGNIEVFTDELIVSDGATINASNFQSLGLAEPGTGEAGNVKIEANSIRLENGQINAATQAGDEGNITLKVAEDIILRDNSQISARALKEATGGNIDIDARFIVAFPNQNNDIIASAQQGTGGNIDITAEAVFGIEERPLNPSTNDLNASSEFGLSGTVNITQPDVNPTSGLLELTQDVVDPADLIAQNVCTQTANSEFIDIGKGGLPQNPEGMLAGNVIEVELATPIMKSGAVNRSKKAGEVLKPQITRKPPAQGWIWHKNGMVELVAYNPGQIGDRRNWNNHRGCQ